LADAPVLAFWLAALLAPVFFVDPQPLTSIAATTSRQLSRRGGLCMPIRYWWLAC